MRKVIALSHQTASKAVWARDAVRWMERVFGSPGEPGAQLKYVMTAHATRVFFSAADHQLMHAKQNEAAQDAFLLVLDCDHAFFLRRMPDGSWALAPMPVRVISDSQATTCALIQPITGQYYSAEPLQPDSEHGPISADRAVQQTWETFVLHPVELPAGLADSRLLADLRRIVRKRPTMSKVLRWSAGSRFSKEVVKAYLFASVTRSSLITTSLEGLEDALQQLSSPEDPWMWKGLPDLTRWERSRDPPPPQDTIGPELDCVGTAYLAPHTPGRIWCATKRLAIAPRRKACVIASARNEGPYLIEWIAHHRAIGFEHIFLYSNNNDDGSDELLSALASNGVITWFDNVVGDGIRPQHKAFGHALGILPHTLDYEWALILDIDEFWMCDTGRFPTVSDYIAWQDTENVQAITFNWCMFGTYGAQRFSPDALVTRRFLLRHEQVNSPVKTMFKPRFFDHAHVHYPFHSAGVNVVFRDSEKRIYRHEETEFALAAEPTAVTAWINHYYSKSIDDILWRGMRGVGDQPVGSLRQPLEGARAALSRLLGLEGNVSSVTDRRALACVPDLQIKVNEILELPGVGRAAQIVNDAVRARICDIHDAIRGDSAGADPSVQLLRRLVFDSAGGT